MGVHIYTKGVLLYRCRLCHAEFEMGPTSRLLDTMIDIFFKGRSAQANAGLVDFHNCADGRLGAADFIGARPDNK